MAGRFVLASRIAIVAVMIVMAGMTGRALAGEKVCPLQVKGMQCSMCAGSVAAALKSVPGVKSAKVDYKTARADVIADDAVKPDQLVSAVRKAGFQATALSATK